MKNMAIVPKGRVTKNTLRNPNDQVISDPVDRRLGGPEPRVEQRRQVIGERRQYNWDLGAFLVLPREEALRVGGRRQQVPDPRRQPVIEQRQEPERRIGVQNRRSAERLTVGEKKERDAAVNIRKERLSGHFPPPDLVPPLLEGEVISSTITERKYHAPLYVPPEPVNKNSVQTQTHNGWKHFWETVSMRWREFVRRYKEEWSKLKW